MTARTHMQKHLATISYLRAIRNGSRNFVGIPVPDCNCVRLGTDNCANASFLEKREKTLDLVTNYEC